MPAWSMGHAGMQTCHTKDVCLPYYYCCLPAHDNHLHDSAFSPAHRTNSCPFLFPLLPDSLLTLLHSVVTVDKPCVDVWGLHRPPVEVLNGTPAGSLSQGLPTILVTGSNGFIAGYVVQELLNHGYHVIGVDNYSKYGRVAKDYDDHIHYEFYTGDVKDLTFMKRLASK
jgi:hypothetical protein